MVQDLFGRTMEKHVSLARALKEKSRLIGRVRVLTDVINHQNSLIEGSTRSVDLKDAYRQVKELSEQLIAIKAAIGRGNQPIIGKIVELGEIKSLIGFLNRLDTSETFCDDYSRHVKKEAVLRKSDVLLEVDAFQQRANALQDELDDFNASHFIDIEIPS